MPASFLVALFLSSAAIALFVSPMPAWVRRLNGLAFAFVAIVYLLEAMDALSMADKAFSLRYSLIIMSVVVTGSIIAWRASGERRRWKRG